MDSRVKALKEQGDKLFGGRLSLLSLWQEIALNFYPERADFTGPLPPGDDFAAHLTTSYPLLARRDLGNAFSAMLRPQDREWFHIRAAREEKEDNGARRWLEWATGLQRRAMYDRATGLVRATRAADHDFAAFGQSPLSVELNTSTNTLLYRSWHLRDVAWCDDFDGSVGPVHRRWNPELRQLAAEFRSKVHRKVIDRLEKEPYAQIECRHVVVPAEDYDAPSSKADFESVRPGVRKWKQPYVSVYIDCDNGHVMEETGTFNKTYLVPRWQLVSGSQYAYSPATVAALADARLIQIMSLTLLEAGEKAANPPVVATKEVIRSDVQLFAGGITWVDSDYDERLGEALRPLTQDHGGMAVGMELRSDVRGAIADAFYLNKLGLPQAQTKEMTAFETAQRIQEYIRNALPLFEPMESEYNGGLCELTFDILLRNGAFGPADEWPQSLRGQEVQFRFESPLHEAIERKKGQTFLEAKDLLAAAAELDRGVVGMVDAKEALRDVLTGIGSPAKWLRSEEDVQELAGQTQAQDKTAALLAAAQQGGDAAAAVGKGVKELTGAAA